MGYNRGKMLDKSEVQLYYCIMNWITTNIRLPEDMYMSLKMQAAQERKSVASVIREKLAIKEKRVSKKKAAKLLRELDTVAKQIAKQNKGVNLSQALIDMRYEQ